MGVFISSNLTQETKTFTLNLAQAAGTYDLATASGSGDLLVQLDSLGFYVTTAGATFTSVSVQTNQTTPVVLLSAAEGAVASLTVNKNLARNIGTAGFPAFILRNGQKIQYTLVGATGTGAMIMTIRFFPTASGTTLV